MTAKNELEFLIDRLTSKEWLWLERFLSSPYHNSDERLLQFWQQVREHNFNIVPELIYPKIFAAPTFIQRKWNDLQRKFLLALHAFLLQEQLRKEPVLVGLAAVNSRAERQLHVLADEQTVLYEELLGGSQLPPWELFTEERRLWQKRYESYAHAPDIKDAQQARRRHQIQYCLLELRFAIEARLAGSVAQEHSPASVPASVLIKLAENLTSDCPLLAFYLLIFQTVERNTFSESELSACEQAYYQWYPQLHPDDQSFFFVKISTFLNRGMRQRHGGARERYFQLQQFGFSEGIFLRNTTMHLHTFLNICMMGTALGKLDWVERFRHQHLPLLPAGDRPKAQLLSDAQLAFGRGEYAAVYTLASQVDRLPKLLRLQFYGLQIKALTERYLCGQITAPLLNSYLRSAKAFVRYHAGLKDNYQAPTLAMIHILQKLVRLREQGARTTKMKNTLGGMWASSPNINAGEWLREKIDQL